MRSLPVQPGRASAGREKPLGRVATLPSSLGLAGLSALTGPQILQAFWSLITGFIGIILSGIGASFGYVLCGPQYSPPSCPGGFAGALVQMFNAWGGDLAADGFWAPTMLLVSLGVAGAVGILFLDVIGGEEGLVADETEL